MVSLLLTNHHSNKALKHATLDISTGLVTLSDERELKNIQALEQEHFSHPLLLEPYTPSPNHQFSYTYDDLDGLLYTAIFIYVALMRTDKPDLCQFTIRPSAQFKSTRLAGDLHLSLNHQKASTSTIRLEQLNRFISKSLGLPFFFSDDIIIHEDQLTLNALPETIQADALYKAPSETRCLLTAPIHLEAYELRYIHPLMGFGVFARSRIKKNTIISVYSGIKMLNFLRRPSYTYGRKLDTLNLRTDAEQQGNLTRFINHAPATIQSKYRCTANIKNERHCLNGIEFVVYTAKREIQPGEQLLTDYQASYFNATKPLYFTKKGRFIRPKYKRPPEQSKVEHMRFMASEGIQAARRYLWIRWSAIFLIIFTGMASLNYL